MIEVKIRKLAKDNQGEVIPKPQSNAEFKIKGIGKRHKRDAFLYTIPCHSNKYPYYVKGITMEEFKTAYTELKNNGSITRKWFNSELSACAKEGGCNFTTIGGIFVLLNLAEYLKRGVYTAI